MVSHDFQMIYVNKQVYRSLDMVLIANIEECTFMFCSLIAIVQKWKKLKKAMVNFPKHKIILISSKLELKNQEPMEAGFQDKLILLF